MADLIPDWICPKCTTPVTPTTSRSPSQWLGRENLSLVSWPQALAPEAQLKEREGIFKYLYLSGWMYNKIVPHDVEDDDPLDRWQLDMLSVHLQPDLFMHILARPDAHHLADPNREVNALVVHSGVEFLRPLLALGVEIQADIGVQADAKVVVHDEDLGVVFTRLGIGGHQGFAVDALRTLVSIWTEHHRPSVENRKKTYSYVDMGCDYVIIDKHSCTPRQQLRTCLT